MAQVAEEPMAEHGSDLVLDIRDLHVSFRVGATVVEAVRGVDLAVARGATHAVVGESGSGKSVTMMSALGLHGEGATVRGSIRLDGRELVGLPEPAMRHVRGAEIGVIFQDPLSSLNPVKTVGAQILEAMRAHRATASKATKARVVELLDEVGIPDPEVRARQYPHQFSGGMRQRVMIAMALSAEPQVLIADEATTALDVTVQAQILRLVQRITAERDMTTIWISHDLGVVAQIADQVTVMQHGRVVEAAGCRSIFAHPKQQYTIDLLASVPRLDTPMRELPEPDHSAPAPAVAVEGLEVGYRVRSGRLGRSDFHCAVNKVSFSLAPGETLGLVGESGSGKSTLVRALLGLELPREGVIRHHGTAVGAADRSALKQLRRTSQMVFQDPSSSMNPGLNVREIVTEPLLINRSSSRKERHTRAAELLELVELPADFADRHPHQLSGGQRQRVAIARALSLSPSLLICDEPVSALDVSVQTQILQLLRRLQDELGISMLIISHDLAVIRDIAHRVAVMKQGSIVEMGDRQAIFDNPQHPYTKSLLAAVPVPDPCRRDHRGLTSSGPAPAEPPSETEP